jgi:hypothetical protein
VVNSLLLRVNSRPFAVAFVFLAAHLQPARHSFSDGWVHLRLFRVFASIRGSICHLSFVIFYYLDKCGFLEKRNMRSERSFY